MAITAVGAMQAARPSRTRTLKVRATLITILGLVVAGLLATLDYPWNWRAPWEYRALFLDGFAMTLAVSAGAIVLGAIIGLVAGVARVSESVWPREAATLYVEAIRGTPLLVQVYIFYFCLAVIARVDDPVLVGIVTLAVFAGAYITEMVRAGIESVDKGQWEAALATGMPRAMALSSVILPQALPRIIPPLAGQFVSLVKDSSLLSVISVREMTKAAEVVNATTYKTFEAYLPLAVLYLLITYPITVLTYHLERRITRQR